MVNIWDYFANFYSLSEESRERLLPLIKEKKYHKNEILQNVGNTCRTIYFVTDGLARIFYYKDGNDVTEHFAFDGQVIVRAESLFTEKPTQKGIQILNDSTITSIDSSNLFSLYDDYHEIERLFRLIFENEYVNTIKRIESLQFKTATERYLELLQETDYISKIPLKYIASYLGITQVSLSRIRASVIKP